MAAVGFSLNRPTGPAWSPWQVKFNPSSLANARLFAQGMADLTQRAVALEYQESTTPGVGAIREEFTPAPPTVSNGSVAIAAGSYVKTAPAGAITDVEP